MYSYPSKLHIKLNIGILEKLKKSSLNLLEGRDPFMMMQQHVRFSFQMPPFNKTWELQSFKAYFLWKKCYAGCTWSKIQKKLILCVFWSRDFGQDV